MKATLMVYVLMFCKSLEAYCISLELGKKGMSFDFCIQRLNEKHKITLDDIKNTELKEKLEEEMQKMKKQDFGNIINIMDKIIEYPIFTSLNIIDRSFTYINRRETKKIGDREYIEGINILDYNKLIKNLNLSKDVYVTNSMIESYIKNLVFEKCNGLIPKKMLMFERILISNIRNLCVVSEKKTNGSNQILRIDNYNNLVFKEVVINRAKVYYLPIKKNVLGVIPTKDTFFGLKDYITLYFYTTTSLKKVNILENELLIVIKKDTLRNQKKENILKRLKRNLQRKKDIEILEEVHEDKDILMMIVK